MNELFILSAQRSGSNWLHTCLNQHSNIRIAGEVYPSEALYLFDSLKTGDPKSYSRLQQNGVFQRIACDSVKLMLLGNLGDGESERNSEGDYIGDKSAYSCLRSLRKHTEQLKYIRLLQKYFPAAKKILLIRDVRDVAVSYSKWGINKSQDLLALRLKSMFLFWRCVSNWCRLHETWINDIAGDDNCFIVRYNDMKTSFRNTLKAVFQFLGTPVNENFLNYLFDHFYDIRSTFYEKENIRRGYAFYRKGVIGEWRSSFKWHHRFITERLLKNRIEKIMNTKTY